jgi:hypothetical protein
MKVNSRQKLKYRTWIRWLFKCYYTAFTQGTIVRAGSREIVANIACSDHIQDKSEKIYTGQKHSFWSKTVEQWTTMLHHVSLFLTCVFVSADTHSNKFTII